MVIRVEQGKGQMDRYAMLSPQLRDVLREEMASVLLDQREGSLAYWPGVANEIIQVCPGRGGTWTGTGGGSAGLHGRS